MIYTPLSYMSACAKQYYQAQAERLRINDVPSILDGEPVALSLPDHHMTALAGDHAFAPEAQCLSTNLQSTHVYLWKSMPGLEQPNPPHQGLADKNTNFVSCFFSKLIVGNDTGRFIANRRQVEFGTVGDFAIEALAKEEVDPYVYTRVNQQSYRSLSRTADETAGMKDDFAELFFSVSCHLSTNLVVGRLGGVMIVRLVEATSGGHGQITKTPGIHYGGQRTRSLAALTPVRHLRRSSQTQANV